MVLLAFHNKFEGNSLFLLKLKSFSDNKCYFLFSWNRNVFALTSRGLISVPIFISPSLCLSHLFFVVLFWPGIRVLFVFNTNSNGLNKSGREPSTPRPVCVSPVLPTGSFSAQPQMNEQLKGCKSSQKASEITKQDGAPMSFRVSGKDHVPKWGWDPKLLKHFPTRTDRWMIYEYMTKKSEIFWCGTNRIHVFFKRKLGVVRLEAIITVSNLCSLQNWSHRLPSVWLAVVWQKNLPVLLKQLWT